MKKFAIGCGIVVLVFAIAGIGISYWLYRKVATTVSQMSELSNVPALEREVRNTAAFTPPASGELTASQVERLVQVQTQVRQRLGQRFDEMREKYKTLMDKPEATALDLPQLISAYRDLASSWMDAKRAQVEALNAAGFSLEEYRWVRSQVYAAIGVPIMEVDVSRMIEDITAGRTPPESSTHIGGSVGPSGPEQNRKLIEPFRKPLEDNAPLASFGL